MFTAMALAGAMAVALSIGYLRTTTDRKIHDIGEVGAAVQAPFLGHLPRFRSENLLKDVGGAVTAEGGPAAIQVAQRAQQTLMESIRMIRTALLERVNETGEKVLLITSAQSASGKSSVALLLARTLSLVGKRVLLVEGDLRKPTLGERLSIESSLGLAAMLCGKATEEQAKEGSRHLPFDVIAAGEIPEEFDVELLSNGAFSGCIQRWRQAYDFVLVDSPPVLPVADARILAGHADGAIMVVRAGHDRRPDAVEAFSLLTASGGRLLGTVFIGGKPEQGYGRTYGYDYGYRYGCRRENQQQTEADVAASA
jgi:non-specific protein-tyrosine kinase